MRERTSASCNMLKYQAGKSTDSSAGACSTSQRLEEGALLPDWPTSPWLVRLQLQQCPTI